MRNDSVVSPDLHDRLTSVLGKLASATDEAEAVVGVDAGTGTGATSAGNGVSSTAGVSRTGTFGGLPVPRTALYRPASRDDFARRLCSFRNAAQWFGKPVTAGPVACARRGWRNAGVDLLECEVCGEKLSFPIPPAWNHEEIQQAGAKFEPKLDSAHGEKCKWRGTCCPVSVCEFPVQAPEKLVSAFVDRCHALGGLPCMPCVDTVAALATMPTHTAAARAQTLATWSGLESKTDDEQTLTVRIAALFGWEVQRLPFKVPATAAVPAERAVCSAADDDSCLLQCTLCGVCVPLWGVRGTAWAKRKPKSAPPRSSLGASSPSPSRKSTTLSAATPVRWQSLSGGAVGLNLSIAGGASPINTPPPAAATNPFLVAAFGASPSTACTATADSTAMPPPSDRAPSALKRSAGDAELATDAAAATTTTATTAAALASPKRARTGASGSEAETTGDTDVPPPRDDGLVVFNPITHHRPYCTWITTPPGASQGPGWLRVLDAVLPPSADAPSTSRITTWNGTGNPMRIVYDIFDGAEGEEKQENRAHV